MRQTICSFRTPNNFFKINLNLLSQLAFPSHWRMRLYYQVASRSTLMERLCHLACRDNSRLDICDIERNPKVWVRQSGLGEMYPNGYLVPNSTHTVVIINDFISTVAEIFPGRQVLPSFFAVRKCEWVVPSAVAVLARA